MINGSAMMQRISSPLLGRLITLGIVLGSVAAEAGVANASVEEESTYRFNHVPFEGESWLYVRRQVDAEKQAWSEERLARGASQRNSRELFVMEVRSGGPVAERYIDIRYSSQEQRTGVGSQYQPVDSGQKIESGRYQLVGTPEDGTIVRDGAPFDHPTKARLRSTLTTRWRWEVIADHLDGSVWRIGQIGAFSSLEMGQVQLELRSVGDRWGRTVAEFAINIEKDSEQFLSRNRVVHIDCETVRPILETTTDRIRVEAVTEEGEAYFEAYHSRVERIYRFDDIPLFQAGLTVVPSGFETPGDESREPIDIGITGRSDTLYIQERIKGVGEASYGGRVGAWDIRTRKPISVVSLPTYGYQESRLSAWRSADTVQIGTPHGVTTYYHTATTFQADFVFANGPEEPEVTASANLKNYTLIGDYSGRVRLGHIGWSAEYGRIRVSEVPILRIAPLGDLGQFVTVDGAGDVRRHAMAVAEASPCQMGSDLFEAHCDGLRIDIEAGRPFAKVEERGCVSDASGTLVASPRGETIGWTGFRAVDGECVRTGWSRLIEMADGTARDVVGSGVAFLEDGRFLTGAGLFDRSADKPTLTFNVESALFAPSELERRVLRTAVSDLYQTAYFLIDGSPRPNYVTEIDLGTGVMVPIWMRDGYSKPRALGISGGELFTLMDDGSVISEHVSDGRLHHYGPATVDSDSNPVDHEYREAVVLNDDGRVGMTLGPYGLFTRVWEIASTAYPQSTMSVALQRHSMAPLAGGTDSQGKTFAAAVLGGLLVFSPGLLPNGVEFVRRETMSGLGIPVSVAVSGSGDRTRVVVTDFPSQSGRTPSLDVYALTSKGVALERTLHVEEALPQTAVAGSGAHSDIVLGPLRPDPATSFWNPSGLFLRRISLETGNTVREVFLPWGTTGTKAPEFDFGPEGIYVLQLTEDGDLRTYDMELGIDLGVLAHGIGDVAAIREASGRWVTQGRAGITKVWNLEFLDLSAHFNLVETAVSYSSFLGDNSALLATILPPDAVANEPPRGAFIFTPDGYYSGDRSRLPELSFADSVGPIDFEKYDLIANRPDVTLGRLGLIPEKDRLRLFEAVKKRMARYGGDSAPGAVRVPGHEILRVSLSLGAGASRITEADMLRMEVSLETSRPVRELVIRVNGTSVYRSAGELESTEFDLSVPLQPGRNSITAHVRSEVGTSNSSRPITVLRVGAPEPSRLFIFAAGVSDYLDDTLDLSYAAKDAEDLAGHLQRVSPNAVSRVVVDEQVDRSTLAEARTFFSAARPGDRAIFFLAGHGFLDEQLDYYFAAHRFAKSDPSVGGFTMEDIDSVFDGSVVLNRAILVDSCHAGDFDEGQESIEIGKLEGGLSVRGATGLVAATSARRTEQALAYSTMKSVFADLSAGSGAHIIAASGGLEYSVEGPQWNNGVFTYSLLQALRSGEADLDSDGLVEIRELAAHVSQSVASLTAFRQVPTSRSGSIRNNFVVAAAPRR